MQIRSLCDAVKCVLLSAPRSRNLAVTRDSFSHQRLPMPISLLRESLSHGKEHCTLVWWDGVRLRSLASARMRAGPRVWEIGRLYLPTLTLPYRHPAPSRRGAQEGGEGEKDLIELLEGLTIYAGSMGAERVSYVCHSTALWYRWPSAPASSPISARVCSGVAVASGQIDKPIVWGCAKNCPTRVTLCFSSTQPRHPALCGPAWG